MKFNDKKLVSLDALRYMSTLADRLMLFYDLFGYQAGGNGAWFPCWADTEIAQVIGWLKPDGTPNAESIRQTRTRLVKAGRLECVEERQHGRIFYSYRPTDTYKGLMDDEALKILSDKIPGVTFCRPGDRGLLELKARIDSLPNIFIVSFVTGKGTWHNVLSDLVDFTQPTTLDFWEQKAIAAVSGRDHALKDIKDDEDRLQVALTVIDQIVSRNLDSNSDWRPRDHVGWMLNALTRVGRESDWMPTIDISGMQQWKKSPDAAKFPTLRLVAETQAKQMSRPAGGTGTPATSALEDARRRHDLSAKRRGRPAAGVDEAGAIQPAAAAEEIGGDDSEDSTFSWEKFMTPGTQKLVDLGADGPDGGWPTGSDDDHDPLDEEAQKPADQTSSKVVDVVDLLTG